MQLQLSPTPVAGTLDPSADDARAPARRDLLRVLRSRREDSVSRLTARAGGLRGRIARTLDAIAAAHRRAARELSGLATEVRGADRSRRRIGPMAADRAAGGPLEQRLQALVADLTGQGWRPDPDAAGLADIGTDGVPDTAAALIQRVAVLTRRTAELERQLAENTQALTHCRQRLTAERRQAQDRETRLLREVDHRTRNALAVVHAIVSLTRAPDIGAFTAAVERRVQALARAHGLLSESCWRGARLSDLMAGELRALEDAHGGQVTIFGGGIMLDPAAVLALALALHELAANAARHGALSHPHGRLEVCWQERDDQFVLTWNETGAPPPPATADGVTEGHFTEGLGLRIVRASVEAQLGGRIALAPRPDGLSCTIDVPHAAARPAAAADRHPRGGPRRASK